MTIEEAIKIIDKSKFLRRLSIEEIRALNCIIHELEKLEALKDATRWIPVTERLPETTDAVNIVWVNHNPPPYYSNIKDKPFSATGHYFKGNWYWYSSVCKDFLNEYGKNDIDLIDNDIEITHWMPLPAPYKKEGAK